MSFFRRVCHWGKFDHTVHMAGTVEFCDSGAGWTCVACLFVGFLLLLAGCVSIDRENRVREVCSEGRRFGGYWYGKDEELKGCFVSDAKDNKMGIIIVIVKDEICEGIWQTILRPAEFARDDFGEWKLQCGSELEAHGKYSFRRIHLGGWGQDSEGRRIQFTFVD